MKRILTGHDVQGSSSMNDDSVRVARDAASLSLRRKRWIGAVVAAVISAPFGIWLGAELWPHWSPRLDTASIERKPENAESPADTQSAKNIEREEPSILGVGGTDSSVSPDPTRLVLISARPGKTSKQGVADIGTDPENPQTFVAGALLQNGAKLAEIHENRVVLERAGKRATLYVMAAEFVRPSSKHSAAIVSDEDRLKRISGDATLASVGGSIQGDHLIKAPPESRSGIIRASQVTIDGIVQGFEVTPGADASKFGALGLRTGDVITDIDGAPLESVAGIASMISALSRGEIRVVTVRRGNTSETLLIDGSTMSSSRRAASIGPPPSLN